MVRVENKTIKSH